jgi:hypothetical protein
MNKNKINKKMKISSRHYKKKNKYKIYKKIKIIVVKMK